MIINQPTNLSLLDSLNLIRHLSLMPTVPSLHPFLYRSYFVDIHVYYLRIADIVSHLDWLCLRNIKLSNSCLVIQ